MNVTPNFENGVVICFLNNVLRFTFSLEILGTGLSLIFSTLDYTINILPKNSTVSVSLWDIGVNGASSLESLEGERKRGQL